MNNNIKRKIALCLAISVSLIMILSECGKKTTATTEEITSEIYASGIIDDMTPIVYGEIEKQIMNKVQEENISEIISPEAYDIIKDKVIENVIINYTSDPEAYLTENQTKEVRSLIKTVVESIDSENLTATLVTDISEQTKAEMSKQIAEAVNEVLSDTTISASTDKNGKVTISSNINSKLTEINKKVSNIAKEVELNKSYVLTEKDKETIEKEVAAQIIASDYIDKEKLQSDIANTLKDVTGTAVQGEKGDRGDDGKTPTKGVDYFTEADISDIVSKVSATFTGTLTNEERTVIVNMLADRINGNTSGDVSGGNVAYNNIQIEQIKNDIINSVRELRGDKGDPGYTPVRGTDYFTDADVESMKEDVIARITHIPEKGVDYFTDDELNVIKRDVIADLETKLEKGDKGDKGDTPIKGVDYFTDEEIEAITTGITNTIKESIDDLRGKVQENADKIALLNEQDQMINNQIEELKNTYLDLSTYSIFVENTKKTLDDLADADNTLQNNIDSLSSKVDESAEKINDKLDDAIYIVSFDPDTGVLKTRSAGYTEP